MADVTVTLYRAAGCQGCHAAITWIDNWFASVGGHGFPYKVVDLTHDDIGRQQMWMAMGRLAFPTLRIGDKWFGGFMMGKWQRALREAMGDD